MSLVSILIAAPCWILKGGAGRPRPDLHICRGPKADLPDRQLPGWTGVRRGSAGAVLSLNAALPFICTFGFSRAGMTWVPANPRNNIEENRYLLDTFDCRVVFFHSDFARDIEVLRSKLPKVEIYVCLDAAIGDIPSLEAFLADASDAPIAPLWQPEAIACIMPTGGTTGASKGVQLTQRNIATFVATYMACLSYRTGEAVVNLAAAPLTHAAGLFTLATLSRAGVRSSFRGRSLN